MGEWLTYSLSDLLLFSPRTYYRLFELYNLAIWPAQMLALGLGGAILVLVRGGAPWAGRVVSALLAACWLWVAWAYLLERYDTINWAARYFALGFIMEALLLVWTGLVRGRLCFRPGQDGRDGRPGLAIFVFALTLHPLIGPSLGRPWTQVELFGLAPDPTVVGTLGVLLAANGRVFWGLLAVPLVWCAISGATLWTMGSPDALVPVLEAGAVVAVAIWKSWTAARARTSASAT